MTSLFLRCIIIFFIQLQRACCEDKEGYVNITLTGYIGYYLPASASPSPNRDEWQCRLTPRLSWGKWENIALSKCMKLYLPDDECDGYVFSKIDPPVIHYKYSWRGQNPTCNFQHKGTIFNGLRFNHFTEYNATQITTVIDRFCVNLPVDLEYASVEKLGTSECIELYELDDCVGYVYELSESISNNINVPLNSVVNSYKPCNRKRDLTTTTETDSATPRNSKTNSETDKNEPAPKNGNPGETVITINVPEPGNNNVAVGLFGLLSLILLLLLSAMIFGMFYLRRRICPHFYEVPTVAEPQELVSLRQNVSHRQHPSQNQNIYGPVLQPQKNIDLLA